MVDSQQYLSFYVVFYNVSLPVYAFNADVDGVVMTAICQEKHKPLSILVVCMKHAVSEGSIKREKSLRQK
jgi:hypothetical protein